MRAPDRSPNRLPDRSFASLRAGGRVVTEKLERLYCDMILSDYLNDLASLKFVRSSTRPREDSLVVVSLCADRLLYC